MQSLHDGELQAVTGSFRGRLEAGETWLAYCRRHSRPCARLRCGHLASASRPGGPDRSGRSRG